MIIYIQHCIEQRNEKMKTNKKVKLILVLLASVLMTLVVLLIVNIMRIVNIEKDYSSMNKQKLNMDENYCEVVRSVAIPNYDWSILPLSKKFRKKFSRKKGILNDESIKEVGYYYTSSKEEQLVQLVVIDGLKEDEYYVHYFLNDQNELDDIEIVKHKLSYDENGKEIIYKTTMNEINYIGNITQLAAPWRGTTYIDFFDYINTTEKYEKKYRGGFVSSKGFEVFSIQEIKELCSFVDKIVYIKCEYPKYEGDDIIGMDDDLTSYYKVHYYTNEKNWLDDVDVVEMSKEEIDSLLANITSKSEIKKGN